MKILFATFIMLLNFGLCAYCQSTKANPFQRVAVPDTIAVKLEEAYKEDAIKVNAGRNVFNLVDRKCFSFVNGIYSFQGQGPHFPRRIFIYYSGNVFIFKTIGAFDPKGVVLEFAQCIEDLNLAGEDVVKYTKAISRYLEQEKDNAYGSEIKK